MSAMGATLYVSGFSPVVHRSRTSAAARRRVTVVMTSRAVLSTKPQGRGNPPSSSVSSDDGSSRKEPDSSPAPEKLTLDEADSDSDHLTRLRRDYLEQSRELARSTSADGGPPRWFSSLVSGGGARVKDAPLLLFLPGMDGVGLGLVLHYKKLGEMFDVWCLHIPTKDRTPFAGLVKFIEETVRSEMEHSPGRPIYLVGESFGGCLALAVAARNQDMDLVLILANPATSFQKSRLQSLVPLSEVMSGQLQSSVLPRLFGSMTVAMVENGLPLQQIIGELSQDALALSYHLSVLADAVSAETLPWKLEMLKSAAEYTNSRLHAVKAQTLILCSGKDQLLQSREEGERLRSKLQTCEIRTFKDAGHALFLEDHFDLVETIKGATFYRRRRSTDYVLDYLPPTPSEFNRAYEPHRWMELAFNPVMLSTLDNGQVVRGLSGVPLEGPVICVGYHMMLGFELIPLVSQFWMERKIVMRGIAHPLMFTRLRDGRLPELSTYDSYRLMGAVPVSASNLYKLLSSKSHALLYPGGMREALHKKGEEYTLFWPEHSEFVRMAARFGAKIVPFGVVGEDDIGQMLLDYDDLIKIPYFRDSIEELTNEVVKLRSDSQGEVANQHVHLPILAPKLPGRFYYLFGKPIETEGRKQELRSRERAHELYAEVKAEVEKCISFLKAKRENDPYRSLLTRLVYQATNGFDAQVPTFDDL